MFTERTGALGASFVTIREQWGHGCEMRARGQALFFGQQRRVAVPRFREFSPMAHAKIRNRTLAERAAKLKLWKAGYLIRDSGESP